MSKSNRSTDLLLVADKTGKILGAAPAGPSSSSNIQARIVPLPGQTLHRVAAQVDLESLLSDPHHMTAWLASHRVVPEKGLVEHKPAARSVAGKSRKSKATKKV